MGRVRGHKSENVDRSKLLLHEGWRMLDGECCFNRPCSFPSFESSNVSCWALWKRLFWFEWTRTNEQWMILDRSKRKYLFKKQNSMTISRLLTNEVEEVIIVPTNKHQEMQRIARKWQRDTQVIECQICACERSNTYFFSLSLPLSFSFGVGEDPVR